MAVGVGDEDAVGLQQAQVGSVLWCQQPTRGHTLGGGGPVVHLADVLRVVHQQRHHADTALRRAVKALRLQKGAPGHRVDAGARSGQLGGGQGLQRKVFTHQQVTGALVHVRAASGGKLDEDVAAVHLGTELGLLAARG